VITVPLEIDTQVAEDALAAFDVKIDRLTKKQIAYRENW